MFVKSPILPTSCLARLVALVAFHCHLKFPAHGISADPDIAGLMVWPSQPPACTPFAPSTELNEIAFT